MRRIALASLLLCVPCAPSPVASAASASAPPEQTCPDGPSEFAEITAVASDLTITLLDGRVLQLAGIEAPRATSRVPTRPDIVGGRLRSELVGTMIGIATLAPSGRWGAASALLFPDAESLADDLLRRGDVRHRPDKASRACRTALLQAEAQARANRAGVWADPDLQIIEAGSDLADATWPAAAAEGMAIVEGSVASVGETASRLYINLGRSRGGFAISVSKRDKVLMASDAVTKSRNVGTRVRVRGLIDRSLGLRLDLPLVDALEVVDPSGGTAAASAR